MRVNIITCPAGQPPRISVRNNTLGAVTDEDLRFLSLGLVNPPGGPVFGDSWQAIALHRGATIAEGVSYQGRSAAWLNVGTRVAAILERVRDERPALWGAIRAEGRLT